MKNVIAFCAIAVLVLSSCGSVSVESKTLVDSTKSSAIVDTTAVVSHSVTATDTTKK